MKICTGCLLSLPLTEFNRYGGSRKGLRPKCKVCNSKIQTEYNAAHKEEVRLYQKAYEESHRTEKSIYSKKYHQDNILKIAARKHLHYVKNADDIAKYKLSWRRANPGMVKAEDHRRRARKVRATIGPVPTDFWEQMLAFYGPHCMVVDCKKANLTLDHIVTLDNGGSHSMDNFQILCGSHNSSKGTRHSTDYRPRDDLGCPIILVDF